MLTAGNAKLGALVDAFSLPPVATCPGMTEVCKLLCYARKGHFLLPSVTKKQKANLRRARAASFVPRMLGEIDRRFTRVLRIHVAGDFESPAAVAAWDEVARRRPDVVFFAYTRSWRTPEIRKALRKFARRRNVHLWYSADRETGPPPRDKRVRVAFLVRDAADEALVPPGAELVFRDRAHRAGPRRRVATIAGSPVCPHERGPIRRRGDPPAVTCSQCRLCFTRRE